MIDPIIITGCARSGTSLTCGLIDGAGAFGGNMFGATNNNAKGFFENKALREEIVKPFLRSIGADPLGQYPLPEEHKVMDFPKDQTNKWRLKIITAIKKDGYEEGPWFFKSVKGLMFWRLFHQAFPNAKWVLVRREKADIAASCMRTSFMRAHRNVEGWNGWIDAHITKMNEMKSVGINVREIWPQKMIDGDLTEIEFLLDWLGLEFDRSKIVEFVAPKLWKGGR